ncbi:MAG: hypothetical protein ACRDRL_26205 [Sciscionella sp.]
MNQPECRNCPRPVADGAALCLTCTAELARQLRSVPALLDDLLVTLSKQDQFGGGKRGKGAEQPLPVRLDVPPVIAALGNTLTTWARDLVDRNGWNVPPAPARSAHNDERGPVLHASTPYVDLVCYAALWLADHVEYLRSHPAVLEAHRGITTAITRTREITDLPADRTRFVVGPCPEIDDHGRHCPGQVWAYVPTDKRDPAQLRCRACPATWDTTQWYRAGARIAARRAQLLNETVS